MTYDYRIVLSVILIGGLVVHGVFSYPALTEGGTAGSTGVSQAKFDAVFSQELTYCQAQPEDINCQCFAHISGTILVHSEPRVAGVHYADKQDLARGQAAQNC